MDKVYIHDLRVDVVVGVYESEKHSTQPLIFDFIFAHDFSRAFQSDDLKDALDYDAIQKCVRSFCQNHRFELLEALAGALMRQLFIEFSALEHIQVKIRKPQAIAPALAAIECGRSRQQLLG